MLESGPQLELRTSPELTFVPDGKKTDLLVVHSICYAPIFGLPRDYFWGPNSVLV